MTSNETLTKKSNALEKASRPTATKKVYRNTVDVKDLRQQKENEKRRKS